jgi:N-ethylmaleimide reductase
LKTTAQKIFVPFGVGRYALSNRIVMAPMTRSRALPDGTPGDLAAEYYSQRASVGLIVTEGTQPSDDGQGYLATPGIYTDAHVAGWKKVTNAVHDKGGCIFIQVMHAGRMSHPDNTPHHRQGVSSSAIAPGTQMFTVAGMKDIPTPRALSIDEISQTILDFRHAARCAIDAGADGVEIHGANGYLVQQFLASSANLYRYLVAELDKLCLAYIHIIHTGNDTLLAEIRALWKRSLVLNRAGRARDHVGTDVSSGLADLEAYGQMILANPDFVARLKAGASMNAADSASFFGGTARGYTDYPKLSEAVPA